MQSIYSYSGSLHKENHVISHVECWIPLDFPLMPHLPKSQIITLLLSVPIGLPILGILSKWNHITYAILCLASFRWSFPDSSAGKESTCNAGDPGSIPGSGRSTREGIGYPLHYPTPVYFTWSSLLAQLVKNLPAMREIWIWTLGWEDPLEKGTANHSSILAWKIPWTLSMGSQRVGYNWETFTLPECATGM